VILIVSYYGYDTAGIIVRRPRLEEFLRRSGRRRKFREIVNLALRYVCKLQLHYP